ncbi:uncharacterized protein HMPREF1541_00270 [Cyphellophora europaea CBS 101466]|uniref:F-box domain-containing protein n=1 Tax=Cyphellophora europaea (strain CBS 101466) TaxID=1220924 RepID=W2SBH3_CYPE1|nr:uncharacterized protein HMPREF1541_00270 [Cyphellophora europaea CBS 101466]ETN46086.1 hypothetical protein HMPREF1541_00270 [Cyphellophora europaea CBS 101466]
MSTLSATACAKAVSRCRRLHGFFFLDLPKQVRLSIYHELFAGNTLKVCSWLKTYEGEFAAGERCQILLTCSKILSEACGHFYFHNRFEFTSQSSICYFTWHDVHPAKWANITAIVLTKTELLPDFKKHVGKFSNLRRLTIDAPSEFRLRVPKRPRKCDHIRFVRFILSRHTYVVSINPHLYMERKWEACLTVQLVLGNGHEEIMLVNLDRMSVWHDVYPVPTETFDHTLIVPSAGDPDAELWVERERFVGEEEWQ